jgi:uncharacterized protein YndB with AHSA1/START domain
VIEVSEQISAVRREVGSRTLEAGEAQVVTISQSYDATVEDVWDACTNPERILRWLMPVSGELRLGGRISSRATRAARSRRATRRARSPRRGNTAAR